MAANLVPIGRFSKISHLSVKALRHYDALGLLKPAYTDPDSGYRYYKLAQALDAEVIPQLRAIDMPLEEIRVLLRAGSPSTRIQLLEQHQQRVLTEIAEKQRILAYLDRLLREPSGQLIPYKIQVKRLPAQDYLGIRIVMSWTSVESTLPDLLSEIDTCLRAVGDQAVGSPFLICHEPEFPENEGNAEIAIPVRRALPGRDRVQPGVLDAGIAASTLHMGSHLEIAPAYHALAAWIQAHGHETTGPPRELYLVGPRDTADSTGHRTEVVWPIR
jgi:DNA-binding transcriptional MerR regulator